MFCLLRPWDVQIYFTGIPNYLEVFLLRLLSLKILMAKKALLLQFLPPQGILWCTCKVSSIYNLQKGSKLLKTIEVLSNSFHLNYQSIAEKLFQNFENSPRYWWKQNKSKSWFCTIFSRFSIFSNPLQCWMYL